MAGADPPPAPPPPRSCVNILITIDPAPTRAADEFTLTARSLTDTFSVGDPVVIGQYPRNGGQCLVVKVPIYPSPPPLPPESPPASVPWWRVRGTHRIPQDGWPEEPAAFGRAIRQARRAADLSQAKLANLAGVHQLTLRNLEHGRHVASPEVRKRLVLALAKAGQAAPKPIEDSNE